MTIAPKIISCVLEGRNLIRGTELETHRKSDDNPVELMSKSYLWHGELETWRKLDGDNPVELMFKTLYNKTSVWSNISLPKSP